MTQNEYEFNKVIEFGEIWERKFRKLLETQKIKEVAKALKIHERTVYKYIDKYGIKYQRKYK
ncbi:hypothetical protein CN946_11335 [Bacillus sp. AFS053548]|nr:hypothetical protein CN946_11335 [Bacillus sp. AFS053548]